MVFDPSLVLFNFFFRCSKGNTNRLVHLLLHSSPFSCFNFQISFQIFPKIKYSVFLDSSLVSLNQLKVECLKKAAVTYIRHIFTYRLLLAFAEQGVRRADSPMVNYFDPRSFLLLRASSVFCDLIVSIVLAAKIHLDNRRRELNRATIKCRMLTNTLFKEVQATLPITFYRFIFEEKKIQSFTSTFGQSCYLYY